MTRKNMAGRAKTKEPAIWSRWWAKFAIAAAALGVLADVKHNISDVADTIIKAMQAPVPPPNLMVSTVDAKTYDATLCLLGGATEVDLYLHLDEGELPIGRDECADNLRKSILDGRNNTEELISSSTFLLIRNEGRTQISKIILMKGAGSVVEYRNLPAGKSFATCLKFDGKAGHPGFGSELTGIAVIERDGGNVATLKPSAFSRSPTLLPTSKRCPEAYMGYPPSSTADNAP